MYKRICLLLFLIIFLTSCSQQLIPEVQECIAGKENQSFVILGDYEEEKIQVTFVEDTPLSKAKAILHSYDIDPENAGVILYGEVPFYNDETYQERHTLVLTVDKGKEVTKSCALEQSEFVEEAGVFMYPDVLPSFIDIYASQDHPIKVYPTKLVFYSSKSKYVKIGYYNKLDIVAQAATVIIDNCQGKTTTSLFSYSVNGKYPVEVTVDVYGCPECSSFNVQPGAPYYYHAYLDNNMLSTGEMYTCQLKIVQEDDHANVYESLEVSAYVS